ncbi:unnamed protein product [Lasius platythorax]|uniref:Uncharacterized protein n=1 Tax=Lasius platythorax TaxID=488582 RepID=A0AAV2NJX9_9HYME
MEILSALAVEMYRLVAASFGITSCKCARLSTMVHANGVNRATKVFTFVLQERIMQDPRCSERNSESRKTAGKKFPAGSPSA